MLRHLKVGYVQGMGFVTAILLMHMLLSFQIPIINTKHCSSPAVYAASFAGGVRAGLRHSHVMFYQRLYTDHLFLCCCPCCIILQVGYVQGMGFVTAILLMYMS
jgi:hypothetical protein